MSTEVPEILLAHYLKILKLPTFQREYQKLARLCATEGVDHVGYLFRLAEREMIERDRRKVERRIKAAKFPVVKSLDSFDFTAIPKLNKMQVLELARCEWIERRENVIALGPSGTGKTHGLRDGGDHYFSLGLLRRRQADISSVMRGGGVIFCDGRLRVQQFVGTHGLSQGWKVMGAMGIVAVLNAMLLFPLFVFCLASGDRDRDISCFQPFGHVLHDVEASGVDIGNWQHVEDEPLQTRSGRVGELKRFAPEIWCIEENNRAVEAKQNQSRCGFGVGMAVQ